MREEMRSTCVDPSRIDFLAAMFLEAMKPYKEPGEEWTADEKELLPVFKSRLRGDLILDLAGGYGRVSKELLDAGLRVVILDLSWHSLKKAKESLGDNTSLDIVRGDMLLLPFRNCCFDGVWCSQAFEYVPPECRGWVLESVAGILRSKGLFFVNVATIGSECGWPRYIANYLYWRVIRGRPVKFGEYIYWLELKHYKDWHYHSLVPFPRRLEKFIHRYFKPLAEHGEKGEYAAYLLEKS